MKALAHEVQDDTKLTTGQVVLTRAIVGEKGTKVILHVPVDLKDVGHCPAFWQKLAVMNPEPARVPARHRSINNHLLSLE